MNQNWLRRAAALVPPGRMETRGTGYRDPHNDLSKQGPLRVAPSVEVWRTYLWGSAVSINFTSHPTYEARSDADAIECGDGDAGGIRHIGIWEEGPSGLVVRKSVLLVRDH